MYVSVCLCIVLYVWFVVCKCVMVVYMFYVTFCVCVVYVVLMCLYVCYVCLMCVYDLNMFVYVFARVWKLFLCSSMVGVSVCVCCL